jgi:hypothetical protein
MRLIFYVAECVADSVQPILGLSNLDADEGVRGQKSVIHQAVYQADAH